MKVLFLFFGIIILIINSCFAQCDDPNNNNLKKTAIVIGVSEYENSTLTNPVNDATDMTAALRSLGFDVLMYTNTDKRTMENAIDGWCATLNKYDLALFYYAGHGAEYQNMNYLFSKDSNPIVPPDLNYETYPFNRVLDKMSFSGVRYKIAILDACRNNPLIRSFRSGLTTGGLAPAYQSGTFIGYATGPGMVASDGGTGRNGIYTAAILKYINTPNLGITQIFTRIGAEVKSNTKNQQEPYISTNLSPDICLRTSLVASKTSESSSTDITLSRNMNLLLMKNRFGSNINQILTYEFGPELQNSITYNSLPEEPNCNPNIVKYYWRYLRESNIKSSIINFLKVNGLDDKITNDSYVVYFFLNNKLSRIEIRLFTGDSRFYDTLNNSLSESLDFNPINYKTKVNDFYYFIHSEKDSGWNKISLIITNQEGYNMCNNDWWKK